MSGITSRSSLPMVLLVLAAGCGGGGASPAGPTCSDGAKNGAETDVDCGGGSCPACANSRVCGGAADCGSGVCGAGTCVACSAATQCPGTDTACRVRTCGAGVCGLFDAVAGTPLVSQTGGDCRQMVCDGAGASRSVALDTDLPTPAAACTVGTCSAGTPGATQAATGSACASGGGTRCDAAGACVACLAGLDCASGVCSAGACLAATCGDGVRNGVETGVDCGGGACPTCAAGLPCAAARDCGSGVCLAAGTCADPCGVGREQVDGDGDAVSDFAEGRCGASPVDTDGDGTPDYLDSDSDGDGVPDACEARGRASPPVTDLVLALLDTDGDGVPDLRDRDSDGDLLVDGIEDANHDCLAGASETSRVKADTDGDGVSDLVEVTLLGVAAANDPSSTPAKSGLFYFLVPYSADGSAAPLPGASPIALSTKVNRADVGLVVDTTGSMGGTLAALKASLSSTVIPALKALVPDLAVGLAGHDDYPVSPYGAAGDLPFYVAGATSGFVTTVTTASQAAANALVTHNGVDGPESQVPALLKAVTGQALAWTGGSLAAATPPAGTFGDLRFRSDALPVLVSLTDASSHGGKRALDKTGTSYDAAVQDAYGAAVTSPIGVDQLVSQLNALGARFVGGAADGGARALGATDPYGYLAYLADKTASFTPRFFAGCTSECCTGVGGAVVAADGPTVGGLRQCRQVFSYAADGTGLADGLVRALEAALQSVKRDVHAPMAPAPGEAVDAVDQFVQKVEPEPAGGTDPVSGLSCATFAVSALQDNYTGPKAALQVIDGRWDTIGASATQLGQSYCFRLTAKPNTTVPPTASAQVYSAVLRVVAMSPGGTALPVGTDRRILFLVPPVP